ncbi:hypothetical protein [Streptomyces sp. NPDC018972]|uniref:hypothetical protein n=1 Tax=Streptomyces sp. NPDC018972 TaxID=3365060 RepID=UPI003799B1A7
MSILEDYAYSIDTHILKLRKRGFALAAETVPPTGQAGLWYADVIQCVPRSGRDVARQIARLCGDDSQIAIPWRSLSDAVGVRDSIGREIAYTQRGVEALTKAGWLEVETTGAKRGARTTFRLMVGDVGVEWLGWIDDEDWYEEAG